MQPSKKKALMVSTIIGFLASFETSDIELLQSMGYEVHIACDTACYGSEEQIKSLKTMGIVEHDISFSRSPFSKKNLCAYRKLKALMNREQFDLVHCHTPVGGVLGRMSAHRCRVPMVIYSAHGFHFYKGCPFKNWILFYPIEKFFSRYTDILITINNEDYEVAKKEFHAKQIKRIHGVGIDIGKFSSIRTDRQKKRIELGVEVEEKLLLAVGELNSNKNHIELFKAMKYLSSKGYKCVIAGDGNLKESYNQYIKDNGLEKAIVLLGFSKDIPQLLQAADIFVFPSLREGLSVALMEAVAAHLPIVCSEIRGNVDTVLTSDSYFNPYDYTTLVDAIERVSKKTEEEKARMTDINFQNLMKYRLSEVQKEMMEIYRIADDAVESTRNKVK